MTEENRSAWPSVPKGFGGPVPAAVLPVVPGWDGDKDYPVGALAFDNGYLFQKSQPTSEHPPLTPSESSDWFGPIVEPANRNTCWMAFDMIEHNSDATVGRQSQLVIVTEGGHKVYLPDATELSGLPCWIRNGSAVASDGLTEVFPTNGAHIDGCADAIHGLGLTGPGAFLGLLSDGTNWHPIAYAPSITPNVVSLF